MLYKMKGDGKPPSPSILNPKRNDRFGLTEVAFVVVATAADAFIFVDVLVAFNEC